MQLKVIKLGDAKLPDYHYAHDAGLDLYVSDEVRIAPGERVSAPTGVAMAIPEGYVGLIWDKSGHSHKRGLKTMGGVVDSGYRGEVKVGIINLSRQEVVIGKHEAIAQMLIQKVEHVAVVEGALDDTERGEKGFGSN